MKSAEREYLNRVAELGCVICQGPAEIHHVRNHTGMGKRPSNYDTIGLCPAHHRTGGPGVALHAGVKTWEYAHGTQLEWLEWVRNQLDTPWARGHPSRTKG